MPFWSMYGERGNNLHAADYFIHAKISQFHYTRTGTTVRYARL